MMIDESAIKLRYNALDALLDERSRRCFAAAAALSAGRGGVTVVSRITGIARSTIGRGLKELRGAVVDPAPRGRVRRAGGGRKRLSETDTTLLADLRALLDPVTRGDPMVPLLWTAKSVRNLVKGTGRSLVAPDRLAHPAVYTNAVRINIRYRVERRGRVSRDATTGSTGNRRNPSEVSKGGSLYREARAV